MKLAFRIRYIILPLAVFILALVLAAAFATLPAEIAYNFRGGATPDKFIGRNAFLAWTLLPQLVFALVALGIIWGTVKMSHRAQQGESGMVRRLLIIMGNMVALPQVMILFAMLDVFLYNAYRIHLFPLWLFAVIVMIAGVAILGNIFYQALAARQQPEG
ncbi:MAG: hypothetical protein ABID87_06105 [Chloroflexota bacterium]